jgi:hypothetical protein
MCVVMSLKMELWIGETVKFHMSLIGCSTKTPNQKSSAFLQFEPGIVREKSKDVN